MNKFTIVRIVSWSILAVVIVGPTILAIVYLIKQFKGQ